MTSAPRPPASRKLFRMLGVSSDNFPPRRVDVAVLFGEELAGRGHRIDWILQSEAACARPGLYALARRHGVGRGHRPWYVALQPDSQACARDLE